MEKEADTKEEGIRMCLFPPLNSVCQETCMGLWTPRPDNSRWQDPEAVYDRWWWFLNAKCPVCSRRLSYSHTYLSQYCHVFKNCKWLPMWECKHCHQRFM
eukprot:g1971.t1